MKKLTYAELQCLSAAERTAYYQQEEDEHTAAAKKAWNETYKKRKSLKTEKNDYSGSTEITFLDETVEKAGRVQVRTTEFEFFKSGRIIMRKLSSKSQLFMVVNGPLKGKKTTVEAAGEDYVRYNLAYRSKKLPSAVLVYVDSL